MKILFTLFIILSSLIASPTSQNIKTIYQSFPIYHYTTSVVTQLDGEVEYIYWDKEEIQVETLVADLTNDVSNYGLEYAIYKGNFKLKCEVIDNAGIIIKQIKNSNTIFVKGRKLKTTQTFKIYIPKRLQEAN